MTRPRLIGLRLKVSDTASDVDDSDWRSAGARKAQAVIRHVRKWPHFGESYDTCAEIHVRVNAQKHIFSGR